MQNERTHFQEGNVYCHLSKKRREGANAKEPHSMRLSELVFSAFDESQSILLFFSFIWLACFLQWVSRDRITPFLLAFIISWSLWKWGWVSWLSWLQCERIHTILEEEKNEIERNREEERAELTVMYERKGLKGDLLDEVVNTLMVDDLRCLQVMLEEEFGLTLGIRHHPLQQGLAAATGIFITSLISTVVILYAPFWLFPTIIVGLVLFSSLFLTRQEKQSAVVFTIWNLSLFICCLLAFYFIFQTVVSF